MKNLGKILIGVLGYVIAGIAIYWGANRCSGKEQELLSQLKQAQFVKQHPASTFVDTAGREHVTYPDGTTAKLPANPAGQKLYTALREGMAGAVTELLTTEPEAKITEAAKVSTRTTTEFTKAIIDSLPSKGYTQVDPWTKLFRNEAGGFKVEQDAGLNSTRYTKKGGLFHMIDIPYISFYSDNPNAKISGYDKYSTPLPTYNPRFKVYTQVDYNFTTKNPSTDIGTSVRIGKFEVGGYGRLDYNLKDALGPSGLLINSNAITPSYGARIRYNIVEQ